MTKDRIYPKGEDYHIYRKKRVQVREDLLDFLGDVATSMSEWHDDARIYLGASEDRRMETVIRKIEETKAKIQSRTVPYVQKSKDDESPVEQVSPDADLIEDIDVDSLFGQEATEEANIRSLDVSPESIVQNPSLDYKKFSVGELRELYESRTGKATKAKKGSLIKMFQRLDRA